MSATGWLLSDHLWEHWMERARMLFKDSRLDEAATLWQAADDMTKTFAEDDPRRAASLDALATLAARRGDRERAIVAYRLALDAWTAAQTWVERMKVAQSARSSMFHLKLESKHRGAYPQITRARHMKTCRAGGALTAANMAVLTNDPDAIGSALDKRREAFGLRESGAAAMAANLGKNVEGRIIDRWVERPPIRYDDERRLYAAALLAPCLVPSDEG